MYRIISRKVPHLSAFSNPSSVAPSTIIPTLACRSMSSTTPLNVEPKFSQGSDVNGLLNTLQHDLLPPHGRWSLTSSGEGIQRLIRFKTFNSAWAFMNRVASECKTAKHHPEWANVYNTVSVRWTTHSPKGLSEKDVKMALFCDEHAKELREVVVEGGEDTGLEGDGVEGLVDGISKAAGDCCVPKKT